MRKENNIQKNDGTGIGGQVEPSRIEVKTVEQITDEQKKKFVEYTSRDWSRVAGEAVHVELYETAIFAFGSELACRRLADAYRSNPDRISTGYSESREAWHFRLELIDEVNPE